MVASGIQYIVDEYKNTRLAGGGKSLKFKQTDTNVASVPMLYWFFMIRWLYYNDQWAYDGLLKLREIDDVKINIKHIWGNESTSKAEKFNKIKFINPSATRGLKPNNQYFKEGAKKVSQEDRDWDPNESDWFAIDGKQL